MNPGAHVYGTSPANQRIESWWSFFRRLHSQGWINMFEDNGCVCYFSAGNVKQTDLLRFCFVALVQQDLDNTAREWNTHRIRPSTGARCRAGVPHELDFLPPQPARDCLMPSQGALPTELSQRLQPSRPCKDGTLLQYYLYLCDFNRWTALQSSDDAQQLYRNILPYI